MLLFIRGTLIRQTIKEDSFDAARHQRVGLVDEVDMLQQPALHIHRLDQNQAFIENVRFEICGNQYVQLRKIEIKPLPTIFSFCRLTKFFVE